MRGASPVTGAPALRRLVAAAMLAAVAGVTGSLQAQQRVPGTTAADMAARMSRADAAYAAGDRARAEQEYAAVLATDAGQARATFRLAQLRERHDLRGAVALYRRYVALEPSDAWGYIALGDALAAHGDARDALAVYDHAARLAPRERDVHVGRARVLARVRHTDAAIAAYERWLGGYDRDAEAWRELAVQQRVAGAHGAALASLERARALDTRTEARREIDRDIGRNRTAMRATLEPLAGGSRDSDGLMTTRAGVVVASPLMGTMRASAGASIRRAGDGTRARTSQELTAGAQFRPRAQLRFELAGGISRADRSAIDTASTDPVGGPGRGPRAPIGRTGAPGTSAYQAYPAGRARMIWRRPGDAVAVDARAGRQLLDASPFLVAQGVLRDEVSAAVDLRVLGPMRVRGFVRTAAIHNNADERNRRDIIGGALAFVPAAYEVTIRAQRLRYDAPTNLAYFAPRYVNGAELTTYLERESGSGTTLALDLGAGAQQVADWQLADASWSPTLRGWAQVVVPLAASLAAGAELEAYDSRIGMEGTSLELPDSRWRYGSASVWMRVAF